MNNPILIGMLYLLEGYKLLFKPGIKRFVIFPVLINIILLIGLFFVSKHFFSEFNHWLQHFLPQWLQWLSIFFWGIFFLGFFLTVLFTFVTFTNLIGAPFNSFLAEKIQYFLTGKISAQTLWQTIKNTPAIIGRQFAILGYYLPRAILLLVLFFIPLIQVIAAPAWFLFNAWFMTLQCMDYPTDNNQIPIKVVRQKLKEKRWLSLSFGISVLFFSMIPILNFFVVPAAVAGATKLWLEKY